MHPSATISVKNRKSGSLLPFLTPRSVLVARLLSFDRLDFYSHIGQLVLDTIQKAFSSFERQFSASFTPEQNAILQIGFHRLSQYLVHVLNQRLDIMEVHLDALFNFEMLPLPVLQDAVTHLPNRTTAPRHSMIERTESAQTLGYLNTANKRISSRNALLQSAIVAPQHNLEYDASRQQHSQLAFQAAQHGQVPSQGTNQHLDDSTTPISLDNQLLANQTRIQQLLRQIADEQDKHELIAAQHDTVQGDLAVLQICSQQIAKCEQLDSQQFDLQTAKTGSLQTIFGLLSIVGNNMDNNTNNNTNNNNNNNNNNQHNLSNNNQNNNFQQQHQNRVRPGLFRANGLIPSNEFPIQQQQQQQQQQLQQQYPQQHQPQLLTGGFFHQQQQPQSQPHPHPQLHLNASTSITFPQNLLPISHQTSKSATTSQPPGNTPPTASIPGITTSFSTTQIFTILQEMFHHLTELIAQQSRLQVQLFQSQLLQGNDLNNPQIQASAILNRDIHLMTRALTAPDGFGGNVSTDNQTRPGGGGSGTLNQQNHLVNTTQGVVCLPAPPSLALRWHPHAIPFQIVSSTAFLAQQPFNIVPFLPQRNPPEIQSLYDALTSSSSTATQTTTTMTSTTKAHDKNDIQDINEEMNDKEDLLTTSLGIATIEQQFGAKCVIDHRNPIVLQQALDIDAEMALLSPEQSISQANAINFSGKTPTLNSWTPSQVDALFQNTQFSAVISSGLTQYHG